MAGVRRVVRAPVGPVRIEPRMQLHAQSMCFFNGQLQWIIGMDPVLSLVTLSASMTTARTANRTSHLLQTGPETSPCLMPRSLELDQHGPQRVYLALTGCAPRRPVQIDHGRDPRSSRLVFGEAVRPARILPRPGPLRESSMQ